MRKLGTGLLLGFMITSSLFASAQEVLKQDISRVFANGKIDTKAIDIIATDKTSDLKNLNMAIGTIKGSAKPFLLLYNNDVIMIGSIKNRKDGKSVFDNFMTKNKIKIQKAMSKIQQNTVSKDVQNNRKTIALFNGKFKNSMFTIKGGNPKGKTIYLITDPNCPYCQAYEKNEMAGTLKRSKEMKIIPLYLNIPGHETSPMRASWLLEKYKNNKNANMFELMHKASNINDQTYKEVDKKFAKAKIEKMKEFLSMGLVYGTPTIFDENGTPTR